VVEPVETRTPGGRARRDRIERSRDLDKLDLISTGSITGVCEISTSSITGVCEISTSSITGISATR